MLRARSFIVSAMILLFLFFLPASFARDLQVGVSPNRMDMGEISAGTDNYASFSLVTQSKDEILVRLGALYPDRGLFDKPENLRLRNISSDEDVSGWVNFPANPVVLIPANESMKTLGGSVNGWRDAGFNVRVPKNAEPCYYSFQIKPSPYVASAYDTGVNIAAITVVTVLFKVPGNCVREGTILDIQQAESAAGMVAINTYFKNTGNATILAQVADMRLYYENGTEAASSKSGPVLMRPGDTAALRSYVSPDILRSGTAFRVDSTVSYRSGSVTKSAMITLEQPVAEAAEAAPVAGAGWNAYLSSRTIMVLLMLAIIIVSYIIYRRE